MVKRRSFDVSPGKGGIGHNIKKAKKSKNPLKSIKAFGCRKITDFLNENSSLTKALKKEEPNKDKPERKALGEVGNITDNNSTVVAIAKSSVIVHLENKELKEEENDVEMFQEINEIYEKYQTVSATNLAKLKSQIEIEKEQKDNNIEVKESIIEIKESNEDVKESIEDVKESNEDLKYSDEEVKGSNIEVKGSNIEVNEGDIAVKEEEPAYDPEMEGLCEYEKIRLRNIREREQMFAQLQIDEAKSLCSPAGGNKPKKYQKRVFRPKEVIEQRKSRRIAGGVPEIDRFSASFDDHPVDRELVNRPRRSLPENYNDYLHATRTYTGCERPDGLVPVEEGRFKILHVPKKCTIKQFVLSNNLEFKCGRGFYEFTKPEIISHRKEVVLIEKSSGTKFTGRDACKMIGAGSGIRIPPTAFETWRVFVQSTSYGRNLMGGTGFLYEV